jgi:hypothetical protein
MIPTPEEIGKRLFTDPGWCARALVAIASTSKGFHLGHRFDLNAFLKYVQQERARGTGFECILNDEQLERVAEKLQDYTKYLYEIAQAKSRGRSVDTPEWAEDFLDGNRSTSYCLTGKVPGWTRDEITMALEPYRDYNYKRVHYGSFLIATESAITKRTKKVREAEFRGATIVSAKDFKNHVLTKIGKS